MRSRLCLGISAGIFALSFLVVPAVAHHGWAGNLTEEFELTGTVESGVSRSTGPIVISP